MLSDMLLAHTDMIHHILKLHSNIMQYHIVPRSTQYTTVAATYREVCGHSVQSFEEGSGKKTILLHLVLDLVLQG